MAGGTRAGPTPLSSKGESRLRRRPPRRQAVRLWTRPSARTPSYGACRQGMDKCAALARPLPTLGALAPIFSPLLPPLSVRFRSSHEPMGGSEPHCQNRSRRCKRPGKTNPFDGSHIQLSFLPEKANDTADSAVCFLFLNDHRKRADNGIGGPRTGCTQGCWGGPGSTGRTNPRIGSWTM